MQRINASQVRAGDYVHGMGRVEAVTHYPSDSRWSTRLTFDDGHSTMCYPKVELYVSGEGSL